MFGEEGLPSLFLEFHFFHESKCGQFKCDDITIRVSACLNWLSNFFLYFTRYTLYQTGTVIPKPLHSWFTAALITYGVMVLLVLVCDRYNPVCLKKSRWISKSQPTPNLYCVNINVSLLHNSDCCQTHIHTHIRLSCSELRGAGAPAIPVLIGWEARYTCTGRQSYTGLTHGERLTQVTLPFTPLGNLEFPIHLTCMSLKVGGIRNKTRGEHVNSTLKTLLLAVRLANNQVTVPLLSYLLQ